MVHELNDDRPKSLASSDTLACHRTICKLGTCIVRGWTGLDKSYALYMQARVRG